MKLTLTAKIKIMPTTEQEQLLRKTMQTYRDACNAVSEVIFKEKGKV